MQGNSIYKGKKVKDKYLINKGITHPALTDKKQWHQADSDTHTHIEMTRGRNVMFRSYRERLFT